MVFLGAFDSSPGNFQLEPRTVEGLTFQHRSWNRLPSAKVFEPWNTRSHCKRLALPASASLLLAGFEVLYSVLFVVFVTKRVSWFSR